MCFSGAGIGFERAEAIAEKLPNGTNPSYRIKAGILHIVTHNLYSDGHTCLPREKLAKISAQYLSTNEDTADIMIDELIGESKLVSKEMNKKEFIFLTSVYLDENR